MLLPGDPGGCGGITLADGFAQLLLVLSDHRDGGQFFGWSLYLKDSVPTFCHTYPGPERTYVRSTESLLAGRHSIRLEFEKTGPEPMGAGGEARLFGGDVKLAEEPIARTCIGYTDETFDVGWDKGTAVSEDYGPNARFTGRVVRLDFDLKPDFHPDALNSEAQAAGKIAHALIRQ